MQLIILTLFPEYFSSVFATSIIKRAVEKQLITVQLLNIRDFTVDKHRVTDDRPYGGGPGMVMKVEPIDRAIQHCREKVVPKEAKTLVVLMSAKGAPFTQQVATQWVGSYDSVILICGHYEGVDERVALHLVDAEVRVGDFVMTGGEPAAAAIGDALCRLLPDVLGNDSSTKGESHGEVGDLAYPQYTRPEVYRDWPVPEPLLSGHHAHIEQWRAAQRTKDSES